MAIERADIEEKIFRVRKHLDFLRRYRDECDEIFADNEIKKDAILYNLYLLSDRVIRLAEAVCAYKEAGYPDSYSGFIYRLGDIGVLDRKFAYEFAAIAKFRNFLAHQYDDIDEEQICRTLMDDLESVELFLDQIRQAL